MYKDGCNRVRKQVYVWAAKLNKNLTPNIYNFPEEAVLVECGVKVYPQQRLPGDQGAKCKPQTKAEAKVKLKFYDLLITFARPS